MFTVTITEKSGKQTVREFDQPEVSIGRILGNDIVLPKANISKRHARILREGGSFVVIDEKSTNGTFINGKRIEGTVPLGPGDKAFVGEFVIEVSDAGGDQSGLMADPQAGPSESGSRPTKQLAANPDDQEEPHEWHSGESSASEWGKGWSDPGIDLSASKEAPMEAIEESFVRSDARKPEKKPSRPADDVLDDLELGISTKPAPVAAMKTMASKPATDDGTIESAVKLVHQRLLRMWEAQALSGPSAGADLKVTPLVNQAVSQLAAAQAFGAKIKAETVTNTVIEELRGFGPLSRLFDDDNVNEVFVNQSNQVFLRRKDEVELANVRFSCGEAVVNLARRLAVQSGINEATTELLIDCRIEGGYRLCAVLPPLAFPGATLTLKKIRSEPLQIDELVAAGTLSANMAEFLEMSIRANKTVVVSGAPGSGKTTVLNLLANFVPSEERVVVVEEIGELSIEQTNSVRLEACALSARVNQKSALASLMAFVPLLEPQRVIVGQCRGAETINLLRLMVAGPAPVLTTVQATSPEDALGVIETLAASGGATMTAQAVHGLVARGIHLIVQLQRFQDGTRRVTRVSEMVIGSDQRLSCKDIFVFELDNSSGDSRTSGQFKATGVVPAFYKTLTAAGLKADLSIFKAA